MYMYMLNRARHTIRTLAIWCRKGYLFPSRSPPPPLTKYISTSGREGNILFSLSLNYRSRGRTLAPAGQPVVLAITWLCPTIPRSTADQFRADLSEKACAQKTQNICITFVQRQPNVEDVVQMLYKCFVFAGRSKIPVERLGSVWISRDMDVFLSHICPDVAGGLGDPRQCSVSASTVHGQVDMGCVGMLQRH